METDWINVRPFLVHHSPRGKAEVGLRVEIQRLVRKRDGEGCMPTNHRSPMSRGNRSQSAS